MNQDNIPVLDDLIERGSEITLSDLGLDGEPPRSVEGAHAADFEFDAGDAAPLAVDPATETLATADRFSTGRAGANPSSDDPLIDNPALEQAIRRILEEHMERAWQEIRIAIQQHLNRF